MARPLGDITAALLCAAAYGPCTVKELAQRACVGYAMGRVTASRMIGRGQLVRKTPANVRPAIVALAVDTEPDERAADLSRVLRAWSNTAASIPA